MFEHFCLSFHRTTVRRSFLSAELRATGEGLDIGGNCIQERLTVGVLLRRVFTKLRCKVPNELGLIMQYWWVATSWAWCCGAWHDTVEGIASIFLLGTLFSCSLVQWIWDARSAKFSPCVNLPPCVRIAASPPLTRGSWNVWSFLCVELIDYRAIWPSLQQSSTAGTQEYLHAKIDGRSYNPAARLQWATQQTWTELRSPAHEVFSLSSVRILVLREPVTYLCYAYLRYCF